MAQFKFEEDDKGTITPFSLNSTMAQFKLDMALALAMVMTMGLNSTMAQFKFPLGIFDDDRMSSESQFHDGSIQIQSKIYQILRRSNVSIPRWLNSNTWICFKINL